MVRKQIVNGREDFHLQDYSRRIVLENHVGWGDCSPVQFVVVRWKFTPTFEDQQNVNMHFVEPLKWNECTQFNVVHLW